MSNDTITARISAAVKGQTRQTSTRAKARKKRAWTDEQKNAYKLAKRAEYEQLALLSKSLKEGENFGLEMFWSANRAAHNWYCDSSQYSELNSALIAIQLDRTPTEVHTAAQWKARKIWIKKGEHAAKIWIPVIEEEKAQVKTDENGTILTEKEAEKAKEEGRLKCWRVGNVFDRSQTTADEQQADPADPAPTPDPETAHAETAEPAPETPTSAPEPTPEPQKAEEDDWTRRHVIFYDPFKKPAETSDATELETIPF